MLVLVYGIVLVVVHVRSLVYVLVLVPVFVIMVQLVFGVHRLVFVFVIVLSDTSMSHLIRLSLEMIKLST